VKRLIGLVLVSAIAIGPAMAAKPQIQWDQDCDFSRVQTLAWKDSAGREQSMSWKELADWRGNRADAVRLAGGLPKSNKFLRGVE